MFTGFEGLEDFKQLVVDGGIGMSLAFISCEVDVGFQPGVVVEGCDGMPVHIQVLKKEEELTTLEIRNGVVFALLASATDRRLEWT